MRSPPIMTVFTGPAWSDFTPKKGGHISSLFIKMTAPNGPY